MRLRFLLPVTVALLAACSDAPTAPSPVAPASAGLRASVGELFPEEKYNTFVDVHYRDWFACSASEDGEFITVDGRAHVRWNVKHDRDGTVTIASSTNMQGGRAVGSRGSEWVVQGLESSREVYLAEHFQPETATIRDVVRFVGKAGAPDFTLRALQRLAKDADGNLQFVVDKWEVSCR